MTLTYTVSHEIRPDGTLDITLHATGADGRQFKEDLYSKTFVEPNEIDVLGVSGWVKELSPALLESAETLVRSAGDEVYI